MHRTRRAAAAAAVALIVSASIVAESAHAQQTEPVLELRNLENISWDRSRPDAFAPAGVIEDQLLSAGEFLFGYRVGFTTFEDNLVGGDSITVASLLSDFATAPISRSEQRHVIELAFAASDVLTLRAAVPFVVGNFEEVSSAGDGGLLVFGNDVTSIGDPSLTALVGLLTDGEYLLHVGAGISAPVGENDAAGERAFSSPNDLVLPYQVQPGSGTWDVRPSATFRVMNERASFGTQVRGVIRAGENDRGYTLGDEVAVQVWGARQFGDWISGSLGVNYRDWSNVEGVDEDLAFDPEFSASPANNTLSQGGSRWELPIGVNVAFREGLLAGYRLSGELVVPITQNLEGPQLGADRGVNIAITRIFQN